MRPIDVVRKVCPRARLSYLAAIENGDALFKKHGITTPLRLAHFLAQICHESGGLEIEWESGAYSSKRLMEIFGVGKHSAKVTADEAVGLAYKADAIFERVYGLGNPKKARELGNTQPGDGFKYRGGGLMQTTGRANYRRMGQRCGVDFEAHPEWVLSADHALKPALAEWTEGNLNAKADANDILAITKRINGGTNGLADRKARFKRIRPLIDRVDLNAEFPAPVAPPVRSDPPPPPTTPKPKPVPTAATEPANAPSEPKPANTTRNATAGVTIGAAATAASQAPSIGWMLAILAAGVVAAVLIVLIWKRKE